MGNCYGKFAVDYAIDQIGNVCGKYSKYAEEMDEINFYNYPKNGVANSCKLFVDNCVLHACTEPTYDEDPDGAKWTAYYMLCEPDNPKYNSGAGCVQSVDYYKAKDQWIDSTQDMERGDNIFYWNKKYIKDDNPYGVYHTGIIVNWGIFDEGEGFKVVEGNTDGGYVAEKFVAYSDPKILGAGRPRYDAWEPEYSDNPVEDPNPKPEPEPTPEPAPEPVQPPVSNNQGTVYTVCVGSWLNIRTEPTSESTKIGELYDGAKVIVYEQEDGWARIGDNMWVFADFLE